MIKGILVIYSSRPDRAGNAYYAFTYADTASGQLIDATFTGDRSNAHAAVASYMGMEAEECLVVEKEITGRDYERLVKGWPYAGCPSKALAEFIKERLGRPAVTVVHILKFGLPMCHFTRDVPADWPPGHAFIVKPPYGANLDDITCRKCRQVWGRTSHVPER